MFNITVFFIIMLIIWLTLVSLPTRDFVAPDFVFTSSMLICSFFYILLGEYWGSDISNDTFQIMLLGSCLFIICSYIIRSNIIFKQKSRCITDIAFRESYVNARILKCIIFFSIFLMICSFVKIDEVGGVSVYRDLRNHGLLQGQFWTNQLSKLLSASALVLAYIVLYYKVHKWNLKNSNSVMATSIISMMACFFYSMGRMVIIEFFLSIIIMHILLLYSISRPVPLKKYLQYSIFFILCIPFFYYSSTFVGRNMVNVSQYSPIFYVGRYLSCGIDFFNDIVSSNYHTQYFGQASFAAIYAKFFIDIILPANTENFVYHFFSTKYGNTLTIFGRWYEDFYIIGVYMMTSIVSILYAIYYKFYVSIKYNFDNFHIIIYSVILQVLVLAGYDDRFMHLISLNFASRVMLIYIVYTILAKPLLREKNEH